MFRDQIRWRVLFLAVILGWGTNSLAQGWSSFRGPWGNGQTSMSKVPQLPLQWSETNNVCWKTPIPYEGWSTPVVMDGQVWVTTATKEGHDFYAYGLDTETGKILFKKHLFHCDDPEPLENSVNCYAAPSSAIELGRVYLHFGSYGTACLDTKTGKEIWKRNDMPCRHYRGPGSSIILYKNLLILTFDGVDVQYVTALDKLTGKEIWKVHHHGYSSSVSPVFAKGLVLAATGNRIIEMWAIRPDGAGDVTDSHVVWRFDSKDVPTTPSPVVVGDLMFMPSNRGAITCLEVETGAVVWRKRIGGNYLASPIVDGDRIYFFSTNGKTTVIRAGRTFEILGKNRLDAGFMASPAAVGKALFLRTKKALYRIEL